MTTVDWLTGCEVAKAVELVRVDGFGMPGDYHRVTDYNEVTGYNVRCDFQTFTPWWPTLRISRADLKWPHRDGKGFIPNLCGKCFGEVK